MSGALPRGAQPSPSRRLRALARISLVASAIALVWAGPLRGQQTNGSRGSGDISAAREAMRRAMAEPDSWPSYGRDYTNQRFSPLTQITNANVNLLRLAWRYRTGIPQPFQASPIVVDGMMFVSLPLNHLVALDARTGTKRWDYVQPLGTTVHCCGPVNRGVAVYGGRFYMGTLDARRVALDARTLPRTSGRSVRRAASHGATGIVPILDRIRTATKGIKTPNRKWLRPPVQRNRTRQRVGTRKHVRPSSAPSLLDVPPDRHLRGLPGKVTSTERRHM